MPLTEKETRSQEDFCLRYMAKILQIRDIDGDFLCPDKKSLLDVLQIFRWSTREVPVLPQDPNMGIYCKRALVWACSDSDQVTREDVAALRNALLVPWHELVAAKKTLTVIEDGTVIDAAWIAELEEKLGDEWTVKVLWPGRTSLERICNELQKTEVFIFATGEKISRLWSWMWMIPAAARIIEVQNEMDPTGDAIHMAGACSLRHELVIMRRGIREPMIKDSVKVVMKTLEGEMVSTVASLPVIWLPRSDINGFYSHAGDSFREMARMWGERGYCQVKEHPTAVMCWWGEVGTGTLLYDRPNLDWLYNAPSVETAWTKGLFGNPPPIAKGKSWSFWARRPRLVE